MDLHLKQKIVLPVHIFVYGPMFWLFLAYNLAGGVFLYWMAGRGVTQDTVDTTGCVTHDSQRGQRRQRGR